MNTLDTTPASPLSPIDTLTIERERIYFWISAVFSVLFWLGLTVGTLGIGLAIAGLVGAVLWLINGMLVGAIRANAVEITATQHPALYAVYREVVSQLQLKKIPELYVQESGGMLNAFATRHCGRDFIVLYSDIIDAYGESSPEIRFLIGHECGHIRSRHILKRMLLLPSSWLPFLHSAYYRACESSCDRFGAYAAKNKTAAMRALFILAAGKTLGHSLKPDLFSAQHVNQRGFFVSLHELLSTYPPLSQRVGDIAAFYDGIPATRQPRAILAYIVAFFSIGGTPWGFIITAYLVFAFGVTGLATFKALQQKEAMQQDNTIPGETETYDESYQYDEPSEDE